MLLSNVPENVYGECLLCAGKVLEFHIQEMGNPVSIEFMKVTK